MHEKIDDLELVELISDGPFGKVYKAIRASSTGTVETFEVFAVKVYDKTKLERPEVMKILLTELVILKAVNHPNIVKLDTIIESNNKRYLVFEFCNGGNLEEYIKAGVDGHLSEAEAVRILRGIAEGFKEFRKHKIMHRDFKPQNVLLNNGAPVIGGLDFASIGTDEETTFLGTPLFMAPEILIFEETKPYNSKVDLWAIGITFYQMLFGKGPFAGISLQQLKDVIQKFSMNGLSLPWPVSEEVESLLRGLLQVKPAERLDWEEFFNHPIFAKFAE